MSYSVLSKYRSELMGAAMLWVMLFHAQDLNLRLPLLNFLRAAGFGGVDIFILLSSMGLAMSLSRRDQSYSAFMGRRAARILPAYYAVMLCYTGWSIFRGTAPLSALVWNASLLYYWVHSLGAFNWYVAGIMLFYAVTPFCFRRLRGARQRKLWVALGGALGLLVCQILMHDGYWNHMDFFYRAPIFFLGLLIGLYVQEEKKLSLRAVLFWGLWFCAGLALLAAGACVDFFIPLCYLFLFTTVPMCLVLCLCFMRLPLGPLWKFLRLVGENSLEIYLLNVSFFSETALLRQVLDFGPGLYYLITFALNIALGILLHRAVAAGMGLLAARRNPPDRPASNC